jgi:hypothetical protein
MAEGTALFLASISSRKQAPLIGPEASTPLPSPHTLLMEQLALPLQVLVVQNPPEHTPLSHVELWFAVVQVVAVPVWQVLGVARGLFADDRAVPDEVATPGG